MKENVKMVGVKKLLNEVEEGKQFDMKYFSYEKSFRQKQESQKVEESNIWRDIERLESKKKLKLTGLKSKVALETKHIAVNN